MLSDEVIGYLKSKYKLHDYHFSVMKYFTSQTSFKDKVCLEIGGSNLPRELLFDVLGVRKWVSIDKIKDTYVMKEYAQHYASEKIIDLDEITVDIVNSANNNYLILEGLAENLPDQFTNLFDICISICSFEHLLYPLRVINNMYRALKNDGIMMSYFGPIWSGSKGHHMWASNKLNFNASEGDSHVPPFAHLLYDPYNFYEYLIQFYPADIAEEAVNQTYFSTRINRLFFEDYEKIMSLSNFNKYTINTYGETEITPEDYAKLTIRYGHRKYNMYGLKIKAFK
jgi:SAM-dependent methyltransferase